LFGGPFFPADRDVLAAERPTTTYKLREEFFSPHARMIPEQKANGKG
jgi:hypothetical protein